MTVRFLSSEWVDAFNKALAGSDYSQNISLAGADSLTASGGTFRVSQEVYDLPDGSNIRVTLVVDRDTVMMTMDDADSTDTQSLSDVTVSLSYENAASLSRGELNPAEALAAGLIRVRGDLSVLLSAQRLLSDTTEKLVDLQASTTY